MSCSCNSNPCQCTASTNCDNEPLSSALNNFITAFFGTLQKTCVNGKTEWVLPCDLEAGFANFPRFTGEGLACYFSRYIQEQQTGPVGPEGPQGAAGSQGEPSVSAKVFNPADQSIPNNVATALSFTSESFDTDNMHDNAVNNSRLTVTIAGRYIIQGQITFNTSSGGAKRAEVRLNGTTVVATFKERIDDGTDTPELSIIQVDGLENLVVGDYVELLAFQDSGAPVNAVGQSNFTWFGMTRHADMGSTGPQGPTGATGAVGGVGPAGPAGPAGAAGIFTATFISAPQVITGAGALTIAHGLGSMPRLVFLRLRATGVDLGYSIGDEVIVHPGNTGGSASNSGMSVVMDATNLNIRYGSDAQTIDLLEKATGNVNSITNANWQAIFQVWI